MSFCQSKNTKYSAYNDRKTKSYTFFLHEIVPSWSSCKNLLNGCSIINMRHWSAFRRNLIMWNKVWAMAGLHRRIWSSEWMVESKFGIIMKCRPSYAQKKGFIISLFYLLTLQRKNVFHCLGTEIDITIHVCIKMLPEEKKHPFEMHCAKQELSLLYVVSLPVHTFLLTRLEYRVSFWQ